MSKTATTTEKRSARRQIFHGSVKTRLTMSDSSVLHGELRDLSDVGAGVAGPTTGLQVGDRVWLAVLYAMIYSVEYQCEVRHIDPGKGFGVAFTGRFKRCLMKPSPCGVVS